MGEKGPGMVQTIPPLLSTFQQSPGTARPPLLPTSPPENPGPGNPEKPQRFTYDFGHSREGWIEQMSKLPTGKRFCFEAISFRNVSPWEVYLGG